MKLNTLKIFVLIVLVVVGFSRCNIFEGGSTSNTVLVILNITDEAGEVPIGCNVYILSNTLAEATLKILTIEPIVTDEDLTYYREVIVDQIDVEYSRSDGLNQEGRDVPFSFSQKVNLALGFDELFILPFNIVQNVAKMEPPLIDLIEYGEEQVLKLEAKVTIHSIDLGGHRLEPAIATVSVWCANYGE
jgi:hypothetical protein